MKDTKTVYLTTENAERIPCELKYSYDDEYRFESLPDIDKKQWLLIHYIKTDNQEIKKEIENSYDEVLNEIIEQL